MIPVNRLVLKHDVGDDAEYHERDAFLYDFQLHEGERTAIACISYAVGGHLATIFKEKAITPIRGQLELAPVCCIRRCPYHANVMNTLLNRSNNTVYIPLIITLVSKIMQKYT